MSAVKDRICETKARPLSLFVSREAHIFISDDEHGTIFLVAITQCKERMSQ